MSNDSLAVRRDGLKLVEDLRRQRAVEEADLVALRVLGDLAEGFRSTTRASSARVRTTTSISRPELSARAFSTLRRTLSALARLSRTTLPLCRYVRTSSKPASSSAERSAGIALACLPRSA